MSRWRTRLAACFTAGVAGSLLFLSRTMDQLQGEALGPPSFIWGTATAAYQVEGAAQEGGRGPSIWDTFSHTKGKTKLGQTGDTACDFYHRFPEDIATMKTLGVKAFRFSLSWSRVLPQGTGQVNEEGLAFYGRLIDALLHAGIEPFVTLYHWDLPQALEDRYKGWLSEEVVPDFAAYADVCFEAFGDRVVHWTTFNEPQTFCFMGYESGVHAPGRCSDRGRCREGNATSEPWVASHHVLLAHAAAVGRFRQRVPRGRISLNLNSNWAEPLTDSPADKAAAQRYLDGQLGLYADPVFLGDYPPSLRARVPALPAFTPEQRAALAGSSDYFALNHYTSQYTRDDPEAPLGYANTNERHGKAIGPRAQSQWLYVVPWGFGKLLRYVHERYGKPELWVTENGVSAPGEYEEAWPEAVKDTFRRDYYQGYLREAVKATHDGVKLRGYFSWSLLDNFEWAEGFTERFGLVYVDYEHGLQRHVKDSARWLSAFFGSAAAPAAISQAHHHSAS